MSWGETLKKHGFKVAKKWMRYDNTSLLFLRHPSTKRLFQIRYPTLVISFNDFGYNDKGQYPRIDMAYKEVLISNFIRQLERHKLANPNFCLESFIETSLVTSSATRD